MGLTPSVNDREYDLLVKQAQNLYDFSVGSGITGLNPPSLNDTRFDLWKKITYYTARLAEAS